MIRLMFICHGNICRSPMAESVMSYLVSKEGLSGKIKVASAAAHTDEIGNPPHRGTVRALKEHEIPLVPHRAVLLNRADGDKYDIFLCMDRYNVADVSRILGEDKAEKVKLLLSYAGEDRPIADPWYTGDFEETYRDVWSGCNALLEYCKKSLETP